MNTNVEVIGLTRLGIKPESTASAANALTTRPSDMDVVVLFSQVKVVSLRGQNSIYRNIMVEWHTF